MPYPFHVDVVGEVKIRFQVGEVLQVVENQPVVDASNGNLTSVLFVK